MIFIIKKAYLFKIGLFQLNIPATSYSSTLVSRAVPSAQQSLTSEFGMGSGGSSAL